MGQPTSSAPNPETETGRPGLRLPIVIGLLIVALFFGALGGWAMTAQLESAAIAPGVLRVDSQRKTVQHLEGGIVARILVREGQSVVAGQPLVELDQTRPQASLELLRGRYVSATALEARLSAERSGAAEIVFPAALEAERGDPKVVEILDGQVDIFNTRRESRLSDVAILEQRIAQFNEEIIGLEGQIRAENTQLKLIGGEIEDVRTLVEKGLARRPRLLALQREQANIEGSRSRNRAQIARARQNIAEARLRISELTTNMINEVAQELRSVRDERIDLLEKIRAAEDVLARTTIRAPQNGIIVDLRVHTPGGVIGPGEALMDIVPSNDRLVVEAQVDPGDIEVVRSGLTAQVRLTALNQRNHRPIDGQVVSVSADSLTNEATGLPYYLARIELSEDPTAVFEGVVLQPGMQAEVIIVTGAQTVVEYLLKPVEETFSRGLRES